MIHCGENGKKWELLHERLRRIVFLPDNQIEKGMDFSTYHAVLIDEAHLLSPDKVEDFAGTKYGISNDIFQ